MKDGGSRRCGGGFAKQVAGKVEKSEAPTLFWECLGIRLDENLDRLLAWINLDTSGRVAKVNLMASSVRSSNDGVRHHGLAFRIGGDIRIEQFGITISGTSGAITVLQHQSAEPGHADLINPRGESRQPHRTWGRTASISSSGGARRGPSLHRQVAQLSRPGGQLPERRPRLGIVQERCIQRQAYNRGA
jgi:hypothetical protein